MRVIRDSAFSSSDSPEILPPEMNRTDTQNVNNSLNNIAHVSDLPQKHHSSSLILSHYGNSDNNVQPLDYSCKSSKQYHSQSNRFYGVMCESPALMEQANYFRIKKNPMESVEKDEIQQSNISKYVNAQNHSMRQSTIVSKVKEQESQVSHPQKHQSLAVQKSAQLANNSALKFPSICKILQYQPGAEKHTSKLTVLDPPVLQRQDVSNYGQSSSSCETVVTKPEILPSTSTQTHVQKIITENSQPILNQQILRRYAECTKLLKGLQEKIIIAQEKLVSGNSVKNTLLTGSQSNSAIPSNSSEISSTSNQSSSNDNSSHVHSSLRSNQSSSNDNSSHINSSLRSNHSSSNDNSSHINSSLRSNQSNYNNNSSHVYSSLRSNQSSSNDNSSHNNNSLRSNMSNYNDNSSHLHSSLRSNQSSSNDNSSHESLNGHQLKRL